MTYQLLRVEAEVLRPEDVIDGAPNVSWHDGIAWGTCVWVSATGDMNDVANKTNDRITFKGNATWLRVEAIGLEYDGINFGLLDKFGPEQVLQGCIEDLTNVAMSNAQSQDGKLSIVYIAVVDVQNSAIKFKGILPMDQTFDSVTLTPFTLNVEAPK